MEPLSRSPYPQVDRVQLDGRLRFGMGEPASTLGADGDSYLDMSAGTFYERVSGTWIERGSVDFTEAVAMVGTRYAANIFDSAAPTEAEWLAGGTSVTDHIDLPITDVQTHKGFAIPATQDSLTVIQQSSGILNERGQFDPAENEADVLQDISGISCKIYVATTIKWRKNCYTRNTFSVLHHQSKQNHATYSFYFFLPVFVFSATRFSSAIPGSLSV